MARDISRWDNLEKPKQLIGIEYLTLALCTDTQDATNRKQQKTEKPLAQASIRARVWNRTCLTIV